MTNKENATSISSLFNPGHGASQGTQERQHIIQFPVKEGRLRRASGCPEDL